MGDKRYIGTVVHPFVNRIAYDDRYNITDRYTRFPLLWYAALFFVTLAFPHAVSAEARLLTKGPALLFCNPGHAPVARVFVSARV